MSISVTEYKAKQKLFSERLGLTEADFEAYRKVRKYYFALDVLTWCADNDKPCTDDLAEEIADFLVYEYNSNLTEDDNFEAAYEACTEDEIDD